jgi:hypothetical protein
MTAKNIVHQIFHGTGLDRIEMHVLDDPREVASLFDGLRLVSALPDASSSTGSPVESVAEPTLN